MDDIHADPQLAPYLANNDTYHALERLIRNPPAGANWSATDVIAIGFEDQMVCKGSYHYCILLKRSAKPGSHFGDDFYEFYIVKKLK